MSKIVKLLVAEIGSVANLLIKKKIYCAVYVYILRKEILLSFERVGGLT